MGIFDRMSNLGKGVSKVWAQNAKDALDRIQEGLDKDAAPDKDADPLEYKLHLLERLRREELLTEEEYHTKRSALLDLGEPSIQHNEPASDSPAPTPDDDEPPPKKDSPRKRRL